VEVLDIMAVMEGNYLDEDSESAAAMRRLLFAAGLLVAAVSVPIEAAEIAALEALLGPGAVPPSVDVSRLEGLLPRRIADVRALASPAKRAILLRDLAVLARADGRVQPAEAKLMRSMAQALGVDAMVVDVVLRGSTELD
jgi:hypothetical protein